MIELKNQNRESPVQGALVLLFLLLGQLFLHLHILIPEALLPELVIVRILKVFIEGATRLVLVYTFLQTGNLFVGSIDPETLLNSLLILLVEGSITQGFVDLQALHSVDGIPMPIQIGAGAHDVGHVRLEVGADGNHECVQLQVVFGDDVLGVDVLGLLDHLELIFVDVLVLPQVHFGQLHEIYGLIPL